MPLCVLVRGGEALARVEGFDPLELDEKMRAVFGDLGCSQAPMQSLDERLDALIAQRRVMLFMKGTPDEPRCGFSAKVVQALRASGWLMLPGQGADGFPSLSLVRLGQLPVARTTRTPCWWAWQSRSCGTG